MLKKMSFFYRKMFKKMLPGVVWSSIFSILWVLALGVIKFYVLDRWLENGANVEILANLRFLVLCEN